MATRQPARPATRRPPYVHLAIVDCLTAGRLLSRQKRIESRFSKSRRPPFASVQPRDLVLFKVSGHKMLCAAVVTRVQYYERLNAAGIAQLRRLHGELICAPDAYWSARWNCRYGSLVWLGRLTAPPPSFQPPRLYGAGWVVLGSAEDLGFAH